MVFKGLKNVLGQIYFSRGLISHWEIYKLTGLIRVKHLWKLKCHFSLCIKEHFATKQPN